MVIPPFSKDDTISDFSRGFIYWSHPVSRSHITFYLERWLWASRHDHERFFLHWIPVKPHAPFFQFTAHIQRIVMTPSSPSPTTDLQKLQQQVESLTQQNQELREALAPLARMAEAVHASKMKDFCFWRRSSTIPGREIWLHATDALRAEQALKGTGQPVATADRGVASMSPVMIESYRHGLAIQLVCQMFRVTHEHLLQAPNYCDDGIDGGCGGKDGDCQIAGAVKILVAGLARFEQDVRGSQPSQGTKDQVASGETHDPHQGPALR